MRLLLLSDTHGDLDVVERLAAETGADAVLHAGDFGFYDAGSVRRLTVREIALRILHSDLPREAVAEARNMRPAELVEFAASRLSMGHLPARLADGRGFAVPVYAVWGNHEDRSVVEAFRNGGYRLENLFLVDERATHRAGPFHVLGLGGNVLVGEKLFHAPIAGGGGRIWSTLSQFGRLVETAGPKADGEIRVLVTHVSPGKEPLVGCLAARLEADLLVSGHMGSPYCAVWNEFGIRELAEAEARLWSSKDAVEEAWREASGHRRDPKERLWIELGLEVVRSLPSLLQRSGGRQADPHWYREAFAINLPDVADGHAVLENSSGRLALETRSRGKVFGTARNRGEPNAPVEG